MSIDETLDLLQLALPEVPEDSCVLTVELCDLVLEAWCEHLSLTRSIPAREGKTMAAVRPNPADDPPPGMSMAADLRAVLRVHAPGFRQDDANS